MLTETDLPNLRWVAYCRISTDAQDGGSQNQESAINEYARRHGLRIADWYMDTTGKNPRGRLNPEFERMMGDARERKFGGILVAYVERFGLINDEIGEFTCAIRKSGVACWAVDLRRDLRDCREDGEFWKRIADDAAQSLAYVQRQGRRHTNTRLLYAQAQKGRWPAGQPPYGIDLWYFQPDGTPLYRVVDNGGQGDQRKRLKINADGTTKEYNGSRNSVPKDKYAECYPRPSQDEGRLLVIRMMFDWVDREGLTPYQIAGRLNKMGKRPLSGGEWDSKHVRDLLRRRLYTGRVVYFRTTRARYTAFDNDHYIISINNQNPKQRPANIEPIVSDEIFPPIVPVEQFNRVQQMLDGRKRQRAYTNRTAEALFRGLLYCGGCGRKMSYALNQSGGHYRCGHGGCFMSIKDTTITTIVETYLAHTKQKLQSGQSTALEYEIERIRTHAPAINFPDDVAEIAELDAAIEQRKAEKEKIAALLVKCPALADTDTYGTELKRIADEIGDLRCRKRENQERLTPEEHTAKIEAAEKALAEGKQREYSQHLKAVISKIVVCGRLYSEGEKRPRNRKHEICSVCIWPVAPLASDLPIDTAPALWLPEQRHECQQPFTTPPVWMKGRDFIHDETWIAENDWKDGPLPADIAESLAACLPSIISKQTDPLPDAVQGVA